MRRNHYRRNAKMGGFPCSASMPGFIVLVVLVALAYWGLDAKCNALGDDIKRKEQEMQRLEDEFVREEARWNANKTPEKLDAALLSHGLSMGYPRADQIVRMTDGGVPAEGQVSLAKFERNPPSSGNVARR